MALHEVDLKPLPLERFIPLLGEAAVRDLLDQAELLRSRAANRIVWNVSSTAVGGGVAEMLRPLLSFARGGGIDARWVVIDGTPEFFHITKRLHNALHGERGDGLLLGDTERRIYEAVTRGNAGELLARVRPDDVVLLHDPQTAGLAPYLLLAGARVVWRCHIGADAQNAETDLGWSFLAPFLAEVPVVVFSRAQYVPKLFDRARTMIIVPSIDPFSPKNMPLGEDTICDVLSYVGLVRAECDRPVAFAREDGTSGTLVHRADVMRLGPAPAWDTPLVVQVSRWDQLKDPVGVMLGFARLVEAGRHGGAEMILAGPNVNAVADDPDGARVLNEVVEHWRALPHEVRHHVHLASLPTHDVDENAVIVNALQRHAAVVVQKSVREGFGLTVTEAMWKSRAVVASAVGGIQDQIEDGVNGLLVRDPANLAEYAAALGHLLASPDLRARLGAAARERVRQRFLGVRHLRQYAEVIERLDALPPYGKQAGAEIVPAPGAVVP